MGNTAIDEIALKYLYGLFYAQRSLKACPKDDVYSIMAAGINWGYLNSLMSFRL